MKMRPFGVCLPYLSNFTFQLFIFPSATPFHLNPQTYQQLLDEIPKARVFV